jgi:hypothetical protein
MTDTGGVVPTELLSFEGGWSLRKHTDSSEMTG